MNLHSGQFPYDVAVLIGRFQPFHRGHAFALRQALCLARNVVVVIGSHGRARDVRNPFTSAERQDMIARCLSPEELGRVRFGAVRDVLYSDHRWQSEVVGVVRESLSSLDARAAESGCKEPRIVLVGCCKDSATDGYLEMFDKLWHVEKLPGWVPAGETAGALATPRRGDPLSASEIRTALFDGEPDLSSLAALVPVNVVRAIADFRKGRPGEWSRLREEYAFLKAYRRQFERREVEVRDASTGRVDTIIACPYPPTFVTVDAVVVQNGHVLLVKRKCMPGQGLLALPGGFVGPEETLEAAVLRELREETRLKVPGKVLAGALKETRVFDHPGRSLRGRTITHAFLFRLDDSQDLPRVRGGDDAARALWLPFVEVMRREHEIFEDHFHIIEYFLARI